MILINSVIDYIIRAIHFLYSYNSTYKTSIYFIYYPLGGKHSVNLKSPCLQFHSQVDYFFPRYHHLILLFTRYREMKFVS